MSQRRFTAVCGVLLCMCIAGMQSAEAATPSSSRKGTYKGVARDPYLGAIVMEASQGQVVFEDRADAVGYPASIVKLMGLLIVLERVEHGQLKLTDPVNITAEASRIGGSQVYLKEGEVFTVDELLYAMMIQSANDAAASLSIHIAGSKQGFVDLMNARAKELGMKSTQFNSVHGLPPGSGQSHDKTTARDLAILAREVVKHADAIRYTSTREHSFRNGTFMMRNHNNLLNTIDGCDGLKTGFISAAGFSIVATARKNEVRMIAVVLGSLSKKTRDARAAELLGRGFLAVSVPPAPVPATNAPSFDLVQATNSTDKAGAESGEEEDTGASSTTGRGTKLAYAGGGSLLGLVIGYMVFGRRRRDEIL